MFVHAVQLRSPENMAWCETGTTRSCCVQFSLTLPTQSPTICHVVSHSYRSQFTFVPLAVLVSLLCMVVTFFISLTSHIRPWSILKFRQHFTSSIHLYHNYTMMSKLRLWPVWCQKIARKLSLLSRFLPSQKRKPFYLMRDEIQDTRKDSLQSKHGGVDGRETKKGAAVAAFP